MKLPMHAQIDAFTEPRARSTDPATSHAAGRAVDAAGQRERIIKLMREYADLGGMTADQVDEFLGWDKSTAGRRMGELVTRELIEVTGETRKTRRAQFARVYRVVS